HDGRTVLFVSHNMGAVGSLCTRAILLNDGQTRAEGSASSVIDKYINEIAQTTARVEFARRRDREGDGRIRFTRLHWENSNGEEVSVLRSGEDYKLALSYKCADGLGKDHVVVSFAIKDYTGTVFLLHQTDFNNQCFDSIPPQGHFSCRISKFPLAAGNYLLNVYIGIDGKPCDSLENAGEVTVEYGDFFGTGHPGRPTFSKFLVDC